MKRNLFLSVLIPGALALTVLVGLAGVRTVYASSTPQSDEVSALHGGGPRGGRVNSEDLASALGITTEELSAAQEEARNAAIDHALEQGLITQAQADTLRSGESNRPFANQWLANQGIDFEALLAQALGISTDELSAARIEARSLAIDRAVEEGRLTADQADQLKGEQALYGSSAFQSAMRSAYEAAVNAAVESGVITQEQADKILASSVDGTFRGPRGGAGGFGHGGGGRRGGFGGLFGGGAAPDEPGQAAPEVTPSNNG